MHQGVDPVPVTPQVFEIVLTGGACGGKTSALTVLAHKLRDRGLHVLTVPEVFTMLFEGGLEEVVREDGVQNCKFQRELFTTYRTLRTRSRQMAAAYAPQRAVIIYDRGELDALAFHDHHCFADMAAEESTTLDAIRDSYAGVMHLVTAADGAEAVYTDANNAARWESPEEARRSDRRILEAWRGHPQLHVIDNSTDFPAKLDRLLAATMAVLGLPSQTAFTLDMPASTQSVAQELPISA